MTTYYSKNVIPVVLILAFLLTIPPPVGARYPPDVSDGPAPIPLGMAIGHGNITESFNDPGNTTLSGSSVLENRNLSLNDIYHNADFDDGTYQGWKRSGNGHAIIDGAVRLVTDAALVLDLDVHDFTFTIDMTIGQDTNQYREGFQLVFFGADPWDISATYRTSMDNVTFRKEEQNGDPEWIADVPFLPTVGQWFSVRVEHRGENFKYYIDDVLFQSEDVLGVGWTRAVLVKSLTVGSLYVDNTTLLTGDTFGTAITGTFQRPFNRWWDKVELKIDTPGDSSVAYSVFDSYNNRSWWSSLQNVTEPVVNISVIFPYETDRLYLEIELKGDDWNFPVVEWVRFRWRPDTPSWSEEIPTKLETLEDEPMENVLNLTQYTGDWFVAGRNLSHEVVDASEHNHVRPVIEEHNLSIELPTSDWYGEETIRLSVSDGEFVTLSPVITVVVHPVNDPPSLAGLGDVHIIEGQETRLDLTPYITDVDNSTGDLRLSVDSPNCTVDGLELVLYYEVGDVIEDLVVHVSDGLLWGNGTLHVVVENVNDPPSVLDVPAQEPVEEVPLEVDLEPYLVDEDNASSELVVTTEDPNVASVEGRVLTLLFDEWVEGYRLAFNVSDGVATTAGGFDVEVTPVNDPPRIVSVGGRSIGGTLEFTVAEGETTWLEVLVEDEDTNVFGYYVTTDLIDVEALYNGTLEVSPRKGDLGEFIVSLVVDDREGGTDEVNITVFVENVNDPPGSVLMTQPTVGKVVKEGMNVTFDVSFDDPDMVQGQVLTITWSSNVSGIIGTFTSEGFAPFTRDDLAPGVHLITVTVSDGEFERSASGELTVEALEDVGPEPDGNGGGDDGIPFLWIAVAIVIALIVISLTLLAHRLRRAG